MSVASGLMAMLNFTVCGPVGHESGRAVEGPANRISAISCSLLVGFVVSSESKFASPTIVCAQEKMWGGNSVAILLLVQVFIYPHALCGRL